MALDAVEPGADNREVQVQFQAEIVAACRLNVVRHGGAATATATAAGSAMQMMSELSFSAPLPPAEAPATAETAAPDTAAKAEGAGTSPLTCSVGSPTEGSSTLIGTLNCLGDAYNPFEFICDEAGFQAAYARLHEAAMGLTWQQFAEGCGEEVLASPGVNANAAQAVARLKAHCDGGKQLWHFFDEVSLAQDNKLVAPRLNLLTFALRPHGGDGGDDKDARPAWEMRAQWRHEMLALGAEDTCAAPYAADASLWLWDLACNVVAASAPAEHTSVCTGSHLNPTNFERLGARFAEQVQAAAAGRPIVLGLQEWPTADSPKGVAFAAAFARHGLSVVCAPGQEGGRAGGEHLAVAYSEAAMGRPQLLDTSGSRGAAQRALDRAAASGHTLDAAATKGLLDTSARKVLAVRFPAAAVAGAAAVNFVVVHAKEPKTAAAATACALFVLELGAAIGGGGAAAAADGGAGAAPMVALLDGNLSSAPLCEAFAAPLTEHGLSCEPPPSVDTTSKQRSLLHGQCYDASKCMRLVRAPKDKLVAAAGTLSEVSTFPRVAELTSGLPSPLWASDHALTTAVLAHPSGLAERV